MKEAWAPKLVQNWMEMKVKKENAEVVHDEELHDQSWTCHPSACERATDGPTRHCLQGAGRTPSAGNGKTEGHDPCCLRVPPLVLALHEVPIASTLPPKQSTNP